MAREPVKDGATGDGFTDEHDGACTCPDCAESYMQETLAMHKPAPLPVAEFECVNPKHASKGFHWLRDCHEK